MHLACEARREIGLAPVRVWRRRGARALRAQGSQDGRGAGVARTIDICFGLGWRGRGAGLARDPQGPQD
eukprot:gene15120-biopygen9696